MEKQSNDARKPKKQHSAPARNWVGDNGKIIEPLFADYFLSLHPMRCFQGRLFTVDGMVEDEAPLKKEIYEQVRYYATTSVARRIEHIVQAIKLACASEPPEIQTDRIHVRNGTYFADGHFTPEKEYCMNRLPIAYVPDAPAPTRWLQFLNELLHEEDIPALQEYIGYCLLPVTKAQKMLLMVGKGGEGKSRIGLILRELFGNSLYTGSLQKVETNRFARADLEYKLLLVDDDMKTEALPQTNNIKTLVTLEDKIDIERKGQQSVQGTLYVRFACFENGSLHALYDKSNGFYRRQMLLTTSEANCANLPTLQKKLSLLLDVKKTLDAVHVTADLDCSSLSVTDNTNLSILRAALIDKEPIKMCSSQSLLRTCHIANLELLLWVVPTEENSEYYNIYDFNYVPLIYREFDKNDKEYPSTHFVMVNKDAMLKYCNIDYNALLDAVQHVPFSKDYSHSLNALLLEMLKAYDESKNSRIELLSTATTLALWIKDSDPYTEHPIAILNYLQSVKHSRTLTSTEQAEILSLIEAAQDNESIYVGACPLSQIPPSLSGQCPSICCRRPRCHLKAPLGLSLLRKRGLAPASDFSAKAACRFT